MALRRRHERFFPGAARALLIGAIGFAAMVFAGCFGGDDSSGAPAARGAKGGILRLGLTQDPGLDPQKDTYLSELFWCCLSRTLLTYNLRPPEEGGTKLYPDLATALPEISDDGLTYTLHLRKGVTYAPPFQDREVSSKDIVRALQRVADPAVVAPNASAFAPIRGWDAAVKKPGSAIAGIETPDAHTIAFHLSRKSARFSYALANPAASPLPPGAATGHAKDYGRYVVSTGPYMVAGSEALDFDRPRSQQKPLSGYEPGRSIKLVRNPSWRPGPGEVREANPDEIRVSIGGTAQDISQKVTANALDNLVVAPVPPQFVRQYSSDPSLRKRLHINPKPAHVMLGLFNLAQPPFDDVHVRRAVSLILDRASIVKALGGEAAGVPAYHMLPPALVGEEQQDDSPYETSSAEARLAAAQDEMKQSKYDPGHTGNCTDAVCKKASVITLLGTSPMARLLESNLAQIGIVTHLPNFEVDAAFSKCADPKQHVGLCTQLTLGSSTPSAAGIAEIIESSNIGGCCNLSLYGATPKQLSGWGYSLTRLPSVDRQFADCTSKLGADGNACWTEFDKYVTYETAGVLPVMFPRQPDIVSNRVRNYTHDLFGFMSLDTVAVEGGSG